MCWLSGEPTLDEMLCDTTVITIMKRDEVAPDDLRVLLQEMSRRLKRHSVFPAPPVQRMSRASTHHDVREHHPA
jgi:hypothetical protein